MPERRPARAADPGAIPVAPSMDDALAAVRAPREHAQVDGRVVLLCGLSIAVALGAALLAQVLTALIGLITNLAFYGRASLAFTSPAANRLGVWVVLVPIAGALVVGAMARWGSAAIRGHGIPEVMEKVLHGESRIPARLMFWKPVSAAVAIGTGGPFGAEGPIIATGGALGSLVGQVLHVTADERKTLLAAGAAAGMAATFGTPVSAVLLAVELLLFEYRARSVIPVALAAATAAAARMAFVGSGPVFRLPPLPQPGAEALTVYVLLGALVGLLSVGVTRLVYAIEDAFERLPIHWMWWPALGAVVVGVAGYFAPRTLGVGYDNIDGILTGGIAGQALAFLVVMKFVSWAVYLGSGTSGGTLAPLFTIGGGAGALLGAVATRLLPWAGVDVHAAALVGMAAIFAGASHALLTSVVFAFETTRQPMGLLPLLAGCSAAYLVSLLLRPHSIMTEKLARRGTPVRTEYVVDHLSRIPVEKVAAKDPVTLAAGDTLAAVRAWMSSRAAPTLHQGFPVVDAAGRLAGVLTRRDLLDPAHDPATRLAEMLHRTPAVVYPDNSLREAADHMVREGVGRLPVVDRADPSRLVGIVTRSDLLAAHATRLEAAHRRQRPVRAARRTPRAKV
ncbi:MAG: Cl-channel voltage-gated family protein [Gemmatimonadetes bacterium]|nr:Cl-channel voltage-gated family protein [Gemmatimonadota bacterium]